MVKKSLIFCFLLIGVLFASRFGDRFVAVIDPAGHAKDLGRSLVEGYERAQTLKFARALKDELIKRYKVYPVVSRTTGEEILNLQIPSFSNRLGAKFFLRIQMYREESEKPQLFLYHHVFNPITDVIRRDTSQLELTPLHKAHVGSIHQTKLYGKKMYECLNHKSYSRYFDCHSLRGLPLKPLVGITAPAILLEIGICRENKWKSLIKPLAKSLACLF